MPLSLDMATTAMANGKLGLLASAGEAIPRGVMHKADGRTPLTDPAEFMADGAALVESVGIEPPGPVAEHKGFGAHPPTHTASCCTESDSMRRHPPGILTVPRRLAQDWLPWSKCCAPFSPGKH